MSTVFRILYTKKYQNTDFYIGIKYVMRKNLILTIHRYPSHLQQHDFHIHVQLHRKLVIEKLQFESVLTLNTCDTTRELTDNIKHTIWPHRMHRIDGPRPCPP